MNTLVTEALIADILGSPDIRFNMADWVRLNTACGATGCIGGHVVIRYLLNQGVPLEEAIDQVACCGIVSEMASGLLELPEWDRRLGIIPLFYIGTWPLTYLRQVLYSSDEAPFRSPFRSNLRVDCPDIAVELLKDMLNGTVVLIDEDSFNASYHWWLNFTSNTKQERAA